MPDSIENCPICKQTTFIDVESFRVEQIDTKYTACDECGLVFMNPRPSEEEVAAFYSSSYWSERRPLEASIRKQRRFGEHITKFIATNIGAVCQKKLVDLSSVLEVGASFGATLDTVKNRILEEGGNPKTFAIEPSIEARTAGKSNYDSITVIGSRLEELKNVNDMRFDLIILSHVLEHLSDPVEALKILGSVLSPDGILFVEVPNYYGHPSLEYVHNYCFTEMSLRNCIHAAELDCSCLKVNGHHEDFPFYLAAIVTNSKGGVRAISSEPVEDIVRQRAAARLAFAEYREGNPRDT